MTLVSWEEKHERRELIRRVSDCLERARELSELADMQLSSYRARSLRNLAYAYRRRAKEDVKATRDRLRRIRSREAGAIS